MNVRHVLLFSFWAWCGILISQENLKVRVILDHHEKVISQSCFNLEVRAVGDAKIGLASQNYRIFYNSGNLSLKKKGITLSLPVDTYDLKIVQDLKGVNAQGTGELYFEKNLGFINFSVVLQNIQAGGILLNGEQWSQIAQMCFDINDFDDPISIILARDEMTASYGRAFIEFSYIDESDQVGAALITSYTDYNN